MLVRQQQDGHCLNEVSLPVSGRTLQLISERSSSCLDLLALNVSTLARYDITYLTGNASHSVRRSLGQFLCLLSLMTKKV